MYISVVCVDLWMLFSCGYGACYVFVCGAAIYIRSDADPARRRSVSVQYGDIFLVCVNNKHRVSMLPITPSIEQRKAIRYIHGGLKNLNHQIKRDGARQISAETKWHRARAPAMSSFAAPRAFSPYNFAAIPHVYRNTYDVLCVRVFFCATRKCHPFIGFRVRCLSRTRVAQRFDHCVGRRRAWIHCVERCGKSQEVMLRYVYAFRGEIVRVTMRHHTKVSLVFGHKSKWLEKWTILYALIDRVALPIYVIHTADVCMCVWICLGRMDDTKLNADLAVRRWYRIRDGKP